MMEPVCFDCNGGRLYVARKGPWLRIVIWDEIDKPQIVYLTKSQVARLIEAATRLGPDREFDSEGNMENEQAETGEKLGAD